MTVVTLVFISRARFFILMPSAPSIYNAIFETSFQSLQVFPNPANTQLTITSDNSTGIDVQIFSSTGKLVKQVKSFQSPTTLNIENLATGMYQVVCSDGQNQKTFRILKD